MLWIDCIWQYNKLIFVNVEIKYRMVENWHIFLNVKWFRWEVALMKHYIVIIHLDLVAKHEKIYNGLK